MVKVYQIKNLNKCQHFLFFIFSFHSAMNERKRYQVSCVATEIKVRVGEMLAEDLEHGGRENQPPAMVV